MAVELGLLSQNQLQELAQSQANRIQHQPSPSLTLTGSWMWNARPAQEDDDSWEVRAFAEDTGNVLGTTWPPRSYTCTFCRREFRSAQALGGHMNVHRRDRARLHQTQPSAINNSTSSSSASSSTLIIPTQEFATNGGLCLLYQLPNPTGLYTPTPLNACTIDSPSTLLSISPFPSNNFLRQSSSFPAAPTGRFNSSERLSSAGAESSVPPDNNKDNNDSCKEIVIEELDLELRLGQRPAPS